MILSKEELRGLLSSPKDDAALQLLLDANEAAIVASLGSGGPLTEYRLGGGFYLFLSRPVESITSVQEGTNTTAPLVLDPLDYRLLGDGLTLQRLVTGPNPRGVWWEGQTRIIYAVRDDEAERKRIQLALVKIDLAYEGVASMSVGGWSQAQARSYREERDAALASYATTWAFA